jgi:AraC-like DNA-binding protein
VFKANGLFAIFGIPQKILINQILSAEDILGNESRLLTEQLESSANLYEMGRHLNTYLTRKFLSQKHKFYSTIVASVSNCILKNKGLASIDKLARDANMGLRNLERRFIDEVGMPPKLYTRITRFYNAIQSKMLHPEKNWTDITYEHGYYDQSHFIKDCKEFSSRSPEDLFKFTPPPTEKFTELEV